MKKLVFLTLLITATLLLTLAFPAAATGPKAPTAPAAVLSSPAAAATTQEYRRPHIHEAIEAMRSARKRSSISTALSTKRRFASTNDSVWSQSRGSARVR